MLGNLKSDRTVVMSVFLYSNPPRKVCLTGPVTRFPDKLVLKCCEALIIGLMARIAAGNQCLVALRLVASSISYQIECAPIISECRTHAQVRRDRPVVDGGYAIDGIARVIEWAVITVFAGNHQHSELKSKSVP